MPNRNVSIYRKVLTPEQTIRYCRVIMRGKDPHPKKVEFRGLIFEADEGDYYLAYRNPRQKWERVGGDPKAAKFAADKKRAELASIATGREDAPQELGQRGIRISLQDACDLYLKEIRCTRAEDTVDLFNQTLTEFIKWMAKEYPSVRLVNEIRRSHMLAYYQILKQQGLSKRHAEHRILPCSPSTAAKKTDRVNQWIRKTLGLRAGQGPVKRSDFPAECFAQEEVQAFTEDELNRFFAACNDEEHLLFSLFLNTGMRNKEMQYLTWGDVDFESGLITICSKPELGFNVKTLGSARCVPITDDELFQRLTDREKKKKKASDFVFATRTGGRIRDFLDRAKKVGERAGIPREKVWIHKFRATAATGLALAGLGFTGVQQLLGHRDPKVTRRYLAKAQDIQLRDQIKAIRQQSKQRLQLVKRAHA
jgi:integrase